MRVCCPVFSKKRKLLHYTSHYPIGSTLMGVGAGAILHATPTPNPHTGSTQADPTHGMGETSQTHGSFWERGSLVSCCFAKAKGTGRNRRGVATQSLRIVILALNSTGLVAGGPVCVVCVKISAKFKPTPTRCSLAPHRSVHRDPQPRFSSRCTLDEALPAAQHLQARRCFSARQNVEGPGFRPTGHANRHRTRTGNPFSRQVSAAAKAAGKRSREGAEPCRRLDTRASVRLPGTQAPPDARPGVVST